MTTEDDFQRALAAHPADWQTRLVFADWLQERGDPRADGMRALGVLRRWPFEYWKQEGYGDEEMWGFHNGTGSSTPKGKLSALVPACHALPQDWMCLLTTETWTPQYRSVREAQDAAALAFDKLPAERRAELLTPALTSS